MPKSKVQSDPAYLEKLALYDRLVATIPSLARKGASNPYTAINGHMASCLHPNGALALRLPPEKREEFLKKFRTGLFEAHGVLLKEYVRVPDPLLADTEQLKPYFRTSVEYVTGLKPKATTRKKTPVSNSRKSKRKS
jgi:hypothetical protein